MPANFSGEEATAALRMTNQDVLAGHRDAFPYTAPVGSFPASTTGLFDLAGNEMEWCEDWADGTQTRRVLRASSWVQWRPRFVRLLPPRSGTSRDRDGLHRFRVVLAPEP